MSIAKDLLYQLAVEHGYNGLELVNYVDEDQLGGYHWRSELSKWSVGSLFESEGQMLYALIRYLKPQTIIEIGSFHGCSTAHMALAVKANGVGKVIAVDDVRNGAFHDQFPEELKAYVETVVSEGGAFMEKLEPGGVDFVFEDSSHSEEDTYRISKAALRALKPGGLLINHDAMHDMAIDGLGNRSTVYEGQQIRAGLTRAGADFKTYIAPLIARDSDCGIAVTRKPKVITVDVPVSVASIESDQYLKPIETSGHVWGRGEKGGLIERGFAVSEPEPLAAEVDHIQAEQFAIAHTEPEPLAKEEDDTIILPVDKLMSESREKKKRGGGRKKKTE